MKPVIVRAFVEAFADLIKTFMSNAMVWSGNGRANPALAKNANRFPAQGSPDAQLSVSEL